MFEEIEVCPVCTQAYTKTKKLKNSICFICDRCKIEIRLEIKYNK